LIDDSAREPLLDIALGPALLQRTAADNGPETLRFYRPGPTVAFSGRDAATPGIAAAVAAAARAGFAPLRRGPGGRAAAYHYGALCIDHLGPDTAGPQQIKPRFIRYGELLVRALRTVGVDAALGPVPGEYCPGEFSVNDGHGHKLVGTAQRLVRGGALFGTVILVADPEPIRRVLTAVYSALGLTWDPGTVGAVQTTAPGVTIDDVHAAVRAEYALLGALRPAGLPVDVLDLAGSRAGRHLLPAG
jgi:lipoate-protein ligase A